jgi:putative ABC transport system ATP-binding protein
MYILLKPLFSRHKGIGVQFTDEPTGNLDEDTAQEITQILKISAHEQGKCVVVVTHSNELARQADVVFNLKNGKIQSLEK